MSTSVNFTPDLQCRYRKPAPRYALSWESAHHFFHDLWNWAILPLFQLLWVHDVFHGGHNVQENKGALQTLLWVDRPAHRPSRWVCLQSGDTTLIIFSTRPDKGRFEGHFEGNATNTHLLAIGARDVACSVVRRAAPRSGVTQLPRHFASNAVIKSHDEPFVRTFSSVVHRLLSSRRTKRIT